MIARSPATEYLLRHFAQSLRRELGQPPSDAPPPPRPEAIDVQELRAALQHIAETMRSELAGLASGVKGCNSEMRRALDVEVDAAL
jgi:hypothetical protein